MRTFQTFFDWAKSEGKSISRGGEGIRHREHIQFLHLELPKVLGLSVDDARAIRKHIFVVATHMSSDAVVFPIFQIIVPERLVLYVRWDDHGWIVSIRSKKEIDLMYLSSLELGKRIEPKRCEGLPRRVIYGPYDFSRKMFVASVPTEQLLVFFWVIAQNFSATGKADPPSL